MKRNRDQCRSHAHAKPVGMAPGAPLLPAETRAQAGHDVVLDGIRDFWWACLSAPDLTPVPALPTRPDSFAADRARYSARVVFRRKFYPWRDRRYAWRQVYIHVQAAARDEVLWQFGTPFGVPQGVPPAGIGPPPDLSCKGGIEPKSRLKCPFHLWSICMPRGTLVPVDSAARAPHKPTRREPGTSRSPNQMEQL